MFRVLGLGLNPTHSQVQLWHPYARNMGDRQDPPVLLVHCLVYLQTVHATLADEVLMHLQGPNRRLERV